MNIFAPFCVALGGKWAPEKKEKGGIDYDGKLEEG